MGQTTAEKIFTAHLRDEPFPGTKVLDLDRVLCHEITTPVAIADLEWRGKDRVFDSNRIKAVIDHVTPSKDSKTALQAKILRDWARRHAIKDFFDVGRNGVCHALFPEKGYIRPGFTAIMGDSHTCTHGAFGAFAAGVGTTDLEVGILKGVCAFREPKTIRINLSGKLQPGVYGLSNHLIDTEWPKVSQGKNRLKDLLNRKDAWDTEDLFALLADRAVAPDRELPDTGVGLEWERTLSPLFITSPNYGTRSSTVLLIETSGEVTLLERSFVAGTPVGGAAEATRSEHFTISPFSSTGASDRAAL